MVTEPIDRRNRTCPLAGLMTSSVPPPSPGSIAMSDPAAEIGGAVATEEVQFTEPEIELLVVATVTDWSPPLQGTATVAFEALWAMMASPPLAWPFGQTETVGGRAPTPPSKGGRSR